ncbi:lipoprotein [Herpetosiphon geysericola]|uniref:DUF4363 domain-containing protein n=1 Tax=Herpetosiphon geysericola TaxID=70996 RepID=A0A0P6YS10_9CHLR|nr:hypothetical protein [Herpetosiphon geysericola]KPL86055.1 hypothetical protein SE18_14320 [Herpetosiphon geysericola]
MRRWFVGLSLLLLLAGCSGSSIATQVSDTVQQLSETSVQDLVNRLSGIEEAVRNNDWERTRALFSTVEQGWNALRVPVEAAFPDIASNIQAQFDRLSQALSVELPSSEEVRAGLSDLRDQLVALLQAL